MSRMALAQEFLDDARLCLENGRYRSAASRAYYATFHAAVALFEYFGYAPGNFRGRSGYPARRWEHGFVTRSFHIEFVHKRALVPWKLGAALQILYGNRIDADYKPNRPISKTQAAERVKEAQTIIGRIEEVCGP